MSVRNFAINAAGTAQGKLDKADKVLRHIVGPSLLGSIVFSWVATSYWGVIGLALSMLVGLVGYFSIWYFVLRLRQIGLWMFILATLNALRFRNPILGAVADMKALLGVAGELGAYYLFTNFVLWTWPFENNPLAFWGIFAAVIILSSFGPDMGIRKWIIWGYTVIMAFAMLYSTIEGVNRGAAFDVCTGTPLYLVDPETGNVHRELEPTSCPVEQQVYSPETGNRLGEITKDQALDRNPTYAESAPEKVSSLGLGDILLWGGAAALGLGVLFLIARASGGSAGAATGGLIGMLIPLAVLAAIGYGGYWLWSTQLTSEAKAAEVSCQAADSPGWVMKLGELRPVSAGCTTYKVNDRLLPYDAAGKALFSYDSPDLKPVDEAVTLSRVGNTLVFRVSESELERHGLTTMRIGFCRKPPGSTCVFPDAEPKIDLKKAEAAIAIS